MPSTNQSAAKPTTDPVKDVEEAVFAYFTNPKTGLKTTELWVSVLALVDSLALARFHTNIHLSAYEAAIASVGNGLIAVAYTASRSWLKAKHLSLPVHPAS